MYVISVSQENIYTYRIVTCLTVKECKVCPGARLPGPVAVLSERHPLPKLRTHLITAAVPGDLGPSTGFAGVYHSATSYILVHFLLSS